MSIYSVQDWNRLALAPWRMVAEATQAAFQNPFFPASYAEFGRAINGCISMFDLPYGPADRAQFNIQSLKIGGKEYGVEEEVVLSKPFCRLLHFKRLLQKDDDPKVLIFAPLSGHYATLFRETISDMLMEHDVYVTDWLDAKMVPSENGKFDIEDFIAYALEFIRTLGPNLNVVAIHMASPMVLAANAILAENNDPAQPASLILIGGMIDSASAQTTMTELAAQQSLSWFQERFVKSPAYYYPGSGRLVCSGQQQLQNFIEIASTRFERDKIKMFQNLVRGDGETQENHLSFYSEYLSVMDVTAEFFLQIVETIYQHNKLAKGELRWGDQLVRLEAIRQTALLTIEGELDDISAPGQTRRAIELCDRLPADMKLAYLQIGVGHYGLFRGRKWRYAILPLIRNFIRRRAESTQDNTLPPATLEDLDKGADLL